MRSVVHPRPLLPSPSPYLPPLLTYPYPYPSSTRCLQMSREKFNDLLGPLQDLLQSQQRIKTLKGVPLLSVLTDTELGTITIHNHDTITGSRDHGHDYKTIHNTQYNVRALLVSRSCDGETNP